MDIAHKKRALAEHKYFELSKLGTCVATAIDTVTGSTYDFDFSASVGSEITVR